MEFYEISNSNKITQNMNSLNDDTRKGDILQANLIFSKKKSLSNIYSTIKVTVANNKQLLLAHKTHKV